MGAHLTSPDLGLGPINSSGTRGLWGLDPKTEFSPQLILRVLGELSRTLSTLLASIGVSDPRPAVLTTTQVRSDLEPVTNNSFRAPPHCSAMLGLTGHS